MPTLVATDVIVNGQFRAELAQDGQSATLTHTDSAGKTRSWRVEILVSGNPISLDTDKVAAIAELFNEVQELQAPLLDKRASEGPLIINTQKSLDTSSSWQWSIPTLDGRSPTSSPFKVGKKSQDIFTKLFANVDKQPSAATALPSYRTDLKGIPNLGNTCFMNAALQGILRMPGIRDYLEPDPELAQESDEWQLKSSLKALFDEFQKEAPDKQAIKGAATTIRNLPSIATSSSPYGKYVFTIPDQHDSFEFLQRIKAMLKLDEAPEYCINQGKIGSSKESHDLDPMWSNPDHEISTIEGPNPVSTVTLNLDAQEPFGQDQQKTMGLLFTQYITPAEMPTCRDVSRRIQKTEFTHPNPKNLCHLSFVLPRFGTELRKNKGQVTCIFSENLMVPIHQEDKTISSLEFQAQSVICHVNGETRNSGHYVTIVREGSGFKEISDHESRMLTPDQAEDMASKNGYIVNYNRVVSSQGLTSF